MVTTIAYGRNNMNRVCIPLEAALLGPVKPIPPPDEDVIVGRGRLFAPWLLA